ncbi:MAG TPA: hypothetical protein VN541_08405 [Tepidisphaeraceae bacterium]|nr:hypothetical protein [Tepidisphaeraceae bacterium]
MPADLQQLMRDVESLSPEELRELRQKIESLVPQSSETPESAFDRELRRMGLVTAPRIPRDPNRPPNPTPVVVEGEPLSEQLIRERR